MPLTGSVWCVSPVLRRLDSAWTGPVRLQSRGQRQHPHVKQPNASLMMLLLVPGKQVFGAICRELNHPTELG